MRHSRSNYEFGSYGLSPWFRIGTIQLPPFSNIERIPLQLSVWLQLRGWKDCQDQLKRQNAEILWDGFKKLAIFVVLNIVFIFLWSIRKRYIHSPCFPLFLKNMPWEIPAALYIKISVSMRTILCRLKEIPYSLYDNFQNSWHWSKAGFFGHSASFILVLS